MALFAALLILIVAVLVAVHFFSRFRRLNAVAKNTTAIPVACVYKPMLRLFSSEDLELVSSNKVLAKQLKQQRTQIFRGYLRSLTRDYGRLLAGIRVAMLQSGVDRPDLASALVKNQLLFALAVCRIEYRLWLQNAGLGTVDVSALVNAIDTLRSQVSVMNPALAAAR